jgi:DEAD/DEAH box helicase domain-containing protein
MWHRDSISTVWSRKEMPHSCVLRTCHEATPGSRSLLWQRRPGRICLDRRRGDLSWSGLGSGAIAPVVQGPAPAPEAGVVVDLESLLIRSDGGSHLVWVKTELDGPASEFGRRFCALVSREAPSLARRLEADAVTNIVYTDRYLSSPLAVRLLAEVVAEMPGRIVGAQVRIQTASRGSGRNPGRTIFHSFEADGLRRAVIADVLGTTDVTIQSRHQMPHARSLELRLNSGATMRLLLDQGFGAWRSVEEVPHDFRAPSEQQAISIKKLVATVCTEHLRGSPVVLEYPAS